MKECPRCKKKLPDEASFCFVCGALEGEKPSPQIISLSVSPKPTKSKIRPSLEYQAESLKTTKDQKPKKADEIVTIPASFSKEPQPPKEKAGILSDRKKDLWVRSVSFKRRTIGIDKAIKIILSPVRKVIKQDWKQSKIGSIGALIGISLLLLLFVGRFSVFSPKKIPSEIKTSKTISAELKKQKQSKIDKKLSSIKAKLEKEAATTKRVEKNLNIAKNYLNIGQYENAIKKSNEVLKLNPNNSKAKNLIKRATEISANMKVVQVFLDHGWYDDAIDILERLREKNPENEAIVAAIEEARKAKKAEKEILGD